MVKCTDCGKEIPKDETVYCHMCGAPLCKECGSTLAKVKFDLRLKEHYVWDSVRLDDLFTYYIIEWLDFLRRDSKDPNPRVWAITRQRA
jgi:NAD-dependent SIR2 family protein deacetylase